MQEPMSERDWQRLGVVHVHVTAMAEACRLDPHSLECIERRRALERSWAAFAGPDWRTFATRKSESVSASTC